MKSASLTARIRAFLIFARRRAGYGWRWYRARPAWQQAALAALLIALLIGLVALARSGDSAVSAPQGRTVTLATVGELSGTGGTVDFIGNVRSVSEADILAQNGGTVRSVNTSIGSRVPAGFVVASLENASERASVLQAEGAYDAAVAARSAQSLPQTRETARDAYRSIFTTLDTTLENQVDASFFGGPTAVGPDLLIDASNDISYPLSRERTRINTLITQYEENLPRADSRTPDTLLNEAESITRQVQSFLNELANAANTRQSDATPEQLAALASARASVNGVLATIASERTGLRTGTVSATASADASVKQALGVLRAAQANLERTVIRAPIAGQVNFLPIRVGDYVTPTQHVATVAQNGTLEVLMYVSEENRDLLAVGSRATIDGTHEGLITSIAPALDPTTKQIEVRVAVTGDSGLVNGQSVHVSLPDLAPAPAASLPEGRGPLLLPLAAVKLRAGDRVVFSVGEENRLMAHPVEVGEVRGDRIEILTDLDAGLRIVADARGLSEGEVVEVAS